MKKKSLYIIITVTFCIMAYLSGIKHTETMTEVKAAEKVEDTASDTYIPLNECIPLEDVACYYKNDSGYICLELKDIQYQLDDTSNNAYMGILEGLEDVTMDYSDRYLDMNTVVGYNSTDNVLMLYTDDGSGYYWEVEMMD